eukprot:gene633-350_t
MFRRAAARGILLAAAGATAPFADVSNATLVQGRNSELAQLSPRKITDVLDSYIIGQNDGKKAVAIALRNRWRRKQLRDEDLQREVMPKNILLIGPTGVGKTEISRRMARITDAPFVKVEATKYTEVGFKGKDVESIIEDLYSNAKIKATKAISGQRTEEAQAMAIDIVYSNWMARRQMNKLDEAVRNATPGESEGDGEEAPPAAGRKSRKSRKKKETDDEAAGGKEKAEAPPAASPVEDETTLEYFKEHYATKFKDDLVTIEITSSNPAPKMPSAMQNAAGDMQWIGALVGMDSEKKIKNQVTKKVSEAIPLATQEALDKLTDENQVKELARTLAEEEGVVFIDEIDKVVAEPGSPNSDISSTGVQQDLLPLVEGSSVTLKDGTVIQTDNILFICSGAFHMVKASDMLAELQGRLPVRVELKALNEEDFRRILTEPKFNLLEQQRQLLKTEGVDLVFTEDGVNELARVTCVTNAQGQNIGARRLNTVLERVMDTYSFQCEDYAGQTVSIDAAVVKKHTEKLVKNLDLAKYLL